jgi:AcrR family transcriptional regulator
MLSSEIAGADKLTAGGRQRKRLTRQERAPDARDQIFAAAAKVVGELGYSAASITRITEEAGMAQGTFYLYFASRQSLFDELLPHVGKDMLHFVGTRVAGAKDILDMEERGFRAFFEFLGSNPGFFRILNEAEVAAPKAHEEHFRRTVSHFVQAIEAAMQAGQVRNFKRSEIETLVYVLMAARSYLYMRYVKGQGASTRLPEKVIKTYMRLVRSGLN